MQAHLFHVICNIGMLNSELMAVHTIYWQNDAFQRAYHVDPSLIRPLPSNPAINVIPICTACNDSLKQKKLPKYCLATGYDFGRPQDIGLEDLTEAEKCVISLYKPCGKLLKLVAPAGVNYTESSRSLALRGHIISVPSDGPQVAAQELPRRDAASLCTVAFIGELDQWRRYRTYRPQNI